MAIKKDKPESNPSTADIESTDNTPVEKEKGGGEPSPAESASLDTIANDLSGTMPEVQEHALEQEKINESEKVAQYSHLKDRDGNGFDATVHKTNKDGEPTLSAKGLLIKKPGRKPGGANASTSTGSVVANPNGAPVQDKNAQLRMQARASGTMAANLILQIGIVAGGDEWHPREDKETGLNEKLMLENSFADYFEATGKTDIPPGMALTVAIGAYALPRFTMPKTQTRLQKAKMAIKQWWVNRKLKKHGLKAEPEKPKEQDKKESNATMAA